jgi:hypothetical protein
MTTESRLALVSTDCGLPELDLAELVALMGSLEGQKVEVLIRTPIGGPLTVCVRGTIGKPTLGKGRVGVDPPHSGDIYWIPLDGGESVEDSLQPIDLTEAPGPGLALSECDFEIAYDQPPHDNSAPLCVHRAGAEILIAPLAWGACRER